MTRWNRRYHVAPPDKLFAVAGRKAAATSAPFLVAASAGNEPAIIPVARKPVVSPWLVKPRSFCDHSTGDAPFFLVEKRCPDER